MPNNMELTNNGEPHKCFTFQAYKGSLEGVTLCNICDMAVDSPKEEKGGAGSDGILRKTGAKYTEDGKEIVAEFPHQPDSMEAGERINKGDMVYKAKDGKYYRAKQTICKSCGIDFKGDFRRKYCNIHCRDAFFYYRDIEKRTEKDKRYVKENPDKLKAKWLEGNKKDRLKSPEKVKARQDLRNAVAQGKITRGTCEVCGDTKVQGHHEDYTKPFNVNWLCNKHHKELHRKHKVIISNTK